MATQDSRWDDVGTTIPAGEAKYVVDGQPVAEYDNKHNYDVTIDIGVLFAFMNSYNANTILKADVDDTPIALTVAEQTVVGRITGGSIDAIALGIADNNIVQIDNPVVQSLDYAKFTTTGLAGRTYAEVRTDINVADGADVTGDNAPQAHNQSASTITSGILAVARGGTGVADDSYDADKVDGCDAGTDPGDVLKLATGYDGGEIYYGSSLNKMNLLSGGTDGYQLTTHGVGADPTWEPSTVSEPISINTQTGTTYTFVLTDAQKLVTFGNSSAIAVTIPTNAAVAFPIGTQIDCIQILAGKVTFGGAGVTINSKGGNKAINGQWVGTTIIKTSTDVWSLLGDLVA